MGKNLHVVPNPKGGWDAKSEGAERAASHHDTQQEAIDAGRQIARNRGSELVIHRPDGRIRDKDTHGNDPCPPRDRK